MKNKIWVLAEPEAVFLPTLIQILAERDVILGILQVHYPLSLKNKIKSISLQLQLFGPMRLSAVILSYLLLRIRFLLTPTEFFSIEKLAKNFNIQFHKFSSLKDPQLFEFMEKNVKSAPVFAQVSRRVPDCLVKKFFIVNKHCSLLPKMAGVYPVFWAMLYQEKSQGITIHQMNEVFDGGRILAQREIPNQGDFFQIYGRLYALTADILISLIETNWHAEILIDSQILKPSYFSFPTARDRKKFLDLGLSFGFPSRNWKRSKSLDLHPIT